MKTLLMWCSPEHAPPSGYIAVYWAQYISEQESKAGNISLPELINENASYWKPRYLSWLETVGKSPCGITTFVEALLVRPGLSYWWMTIPAQNPFDPTSIAYVTLRLWALAQIADTHHVEELRVHDADAQLKKILTLWCSETERKIIFVDGHTTDMDESQVHSTYSHLERKLPPFISGLGYIAMQYLRYSTWHRHKLSSEPGDDPKLTVIDYFANLDATAAQEGSYTSNYWGPLTQILPQLRTPINWIHLEVRSAALPNVRSARATLRGLNRHHTSSRHFLLHDYLTLRVAFKSVVQYARIRKITKLLATRIPWTDPMSGLDVSPLVRSRLNSDFQGVGAARNALFLSLFDEALPFQPAQDSCIYLMENQPWELALLWARMARGTGSNIGVAHVPVRTWDLRYAIGSSGVSAESGGTLPKPSRVAVIDPKSEATMMANGLGASAIVKVEAMRFLSRIPMAAVVSDSRTHTFTGQRVLIFGEYNALMIAKQLQILEELAPFAGDKYTFTFRPHPGKPFLKKSLPSGVSLSEAHPTREALAECDVTLCSNVSSASLDAIFEGIPTLILRDGRVLNGSPLKAGPSVMYVNDAAEVVAALGKLNFGPGARSTEQQYAFYLDRDLTKWRNLLDPPAGVETVRPANTRGPLL